MFDKLKFWKKKDNFDDLSSIKIDTEPMMGHSQFGQSAQDPYAPQGNAFGQQTNTFGQQNSNFAVQQVPGSTNSARGAGGGRIEKDLEIISAKLDALKSSLESINPRLTNIERIAQTDQQQTGHKRTWY